MVRPCRKVGRSIFIAQITILRIGHKPLLAIGKELLKGFALHHLFALLQIDFIKIFQLRLVHTLVIYLLQSIEFLAQSLKIVVLLSIF